MKLSDMTTQPSNNIAIKKMREEEPDSLRASKVFSLSLIARLYFGHAERTL